MCALISLNSICLICINISGIHLVSGTLHWGSDVVVGVHSAGGVIVVLGVQRDYCAVSLSGGSFVSASTTYRIVVCAWHTRVGSFT